MNVRGDNGCRKRGPRCYPGDSNADVAQLVEHHLAKVRVAGSNPVVRSRFPQLRWCFLSGLVSR
jgi:hypothetical protein